MNTYIVKRLGQAVITLFVAITLAFVLFRLMPGGPIQAMKAQLLQEMASRSEGGAVDMERVNRLVELYSGIQPDRPVYVQYFNYFKDIILYQDFGQSIYYNEPVFDILFEAMPWSIFVSVYGLILGFTANILLGALMAYWEGSRFDSAMSIWATFVTSVPYYVGAILFLSFLAFQWELFPPGGRTSKGTVEGLNYPYMAGVLYHAALPIATGFILGFGGGALGMRGNSIRVMGSDYLRVARLRGLGTNRIATRYVARNAILPLYTGFMMGIAGIFSSSVIMERIFTYPGVGWYTFDALEKRDYPLLMGSFIFFVTITIFGILMADLTYGFVDPRIKAGDESEAY